jgi:hypothetical protein
MKKITPVHSLLCPLAGIRRTAQGVALSTGVLGFEALKIPQS